GQRMGNRVWRPGGSVGPIESQGNFVSGDAGEPRMVSPSPPSQPPPSPNAAGGGTGRGTNNYVVVISRDITERKRADEALKASEELNRRILESVPGGIVHVDRDGRILRANAVAQQVLGIKPEELAHLRIADVERRMIH